MNNKYDYKRISTVDDKHGNTIYEVPVHRATFKETRYTGEMLRKLRAERGVGPVRRIKK